MKKLLLVLLTSLSVTCSFSQELSFTSGREKHDGKPQMFSVLSSKFSVRPDFINEVLDAKLNQQFSITITEGFQFTGNVSAKTSEAPGLQTVIIQSSERDGMVLSVSKLVLPDQSIVYRGIIISKHHSDLLLLEKDAITGNYNWNKKNVSRMISD